MKHVGVEVLIWNQRPGLVGFKAQIQTNYKQRPQFSLVKEP